MKGVYALISDFSQIVFCFKMEPYDVIVNQPVVIDNVSTYWCTNIINPLTSLVCCVGYLHVLSLVTFQGSGVIKAGFAGDQIPKCRFPN